MTMRQPFSLRAAVLLFACLSSLLQVSRAVTLRPGQAEELTSEDARNGPAPSFCNPLDLSYRFQPERPSRREAADPTIVVFRKRYFLFASKSGGYWHSPDLASWTFVEPQGLPLEDYAPTAMAMNDKLYFTAFNTQGIWESADPVAGVWTKVATIGNYADPSLFLDDDGKVYLTSGCGNTAPTSVVQLDPANGWQVVGSPAVAAYGDPTRHGWERFTDWRAMILSERPFVEGSWLNKVGGKYMFQYAAPGTEVKGYGDGVFVSNTSATSGYTRDRHSPVSHKPTGFISGAGHSSTFQDLHGRWWHVSTGIVNVRHNMERRVMLFPAFMESSHYPAHFSLGSQLTTTPSMLVDTVLGDFPMRVDQSRPPWQLLSLRKAVTASSTLSQSALQLNLEEIGGNTWSSPPQQRARDYSPGNAVDEDVRTWWSAATNGTGEWLAVDLGRPSTVHAVQVNLGEQGATALLHLRDACRYAAEMSLDGNRWQPIEGLDRRNATRDAPHEFVELRSPVTLRHLRLTSVHVPAQARFSLSGLRVFGTVPGLQPPAPVFSVVAVRDVNNSPQRARVSWTPSVDAEYYIVRYGLVGGPRFHNFQVYDGTSLDIDVLSIGEEYSFSVDAVSAGGWTPGLHTAHA